MLHDMARMVTQSGADLALGFDGDGDRCGVVDNEGGEIFADKVGAILAVIWQNSSRYHLCVGVKSTGLFANDQNLKRHNIKADYWKTGHNHMKRRVREIGALAGFEKSGHYFSPLHWDAAMIVAYGWRSKSTNCWIAIQTIMADLHRTLPLTYASPTMSPYCLTPINMTCLTVSSPASRTKLPTAKPLPDAASTRC